mmetsp:Transcript_68828/g.158077  ORF Transcript_68828/g.158077 Transcript_68828/m.158077 type:complete len:437 (+) Transcript_68828:235-1545(+)
MSVRRTWAPDASLSKRSGCMACRDTSRGSGCARWRTSSCGGSRRSACSRIRISTRTWASASTRRSRARHSARWYKTSATPPSTASSDGITPRTHHPSPSLSASFTRSRKPSTPAGPEEFPRRSFCKGSSGNRGSRMPSNFPSACGTAGPPEMPRGRRLRRSGNASGGMQWKTPRRTRRSVPNRPRPTSASSSSGATAGTQGASRRRAWRTTTSLGGSIATRHGPSTSRSSRSISGPGTSQTCASRGRSAFNSPSPLRAACSISRRAGSRTVTSKAPTWPSSPTPPPPPARGPWTRWQSWTLAFHTSRKASQSPSRRTSARPLQRGVRPSCSSHPRRADRGSSSHHRRRRGLSRGRAEGPQRCGGMSGAWEYFSGKSWSGMCRGSESRANTSAHLRRAGNSSSRCTSPRQNLPRRGSWMLSRRACIRNRASGQHSQR